MTTLTHHISNVLEYARQGHHVDDDDLAKLPEALRAEVEAASARIVALKAAGDSLAAHRAMQSSRTEILDASLAAGIDPQGKVRSSSTSQQVREALDRGDAHRAELQRIVDSVPRGF